MTNHWFYYAYATFLVFVLLYIVAAIILGIRDGIRKSRGK